MKKIIHLWLKMAFVFLFVISAIVLVLAISFAAYLGLSPISVVGWASLSVFIIFSSIMGLAINQGWTQVPEKMQYIIEIYGNYIDYPVEEGLVVLFPWFGFMRVRSRVLVSEQIMKLYLNHKVTTGFGGGDIEFKDCSTSVAAFLYFRIDDSYKATYEVANVLKAIEEKAEAHLRAFLGLYTLDQAISLKEKFNLRAIVCGLDYSNPAATPDIDEDAYKNCEFYLDLSRWGVTPLSYAISDIDVPETVKVQRERKLIAEKDLQVAVIEKEKVAVEKDTAVIKAQAKKEARILEGEGEEKYLTSQGTGLSTKVKKIISSGIPESHAAHVLVSEMKWNAVSESTTADKIILDSGSSQAGAGVEFGAGFSASGSSQKRAKEPEENKPVDNKDKQNKK